MVSEVVLQYKKVIWAGKEILRPFERKNMETKETLGQFFVNRLKRSVIASIGLLTFAVGVYFQLQANLGMQPWHALRLGIANKLSITFGTASIVMSSIIIIIDLLLKERIGLGTFLDAFLVGIGTDICIALNFLPVQTNLIMQVVVLFLGTVICCVGQWFYMTAALSCGPIDSFLLGIGKLFPNFSLGVVNLGILAVVLVGALALQSPIGLGTVLTVFGTGFVMDRVFKVVKFKPRDVVHEGLIETAAALMKAIKYK